MTEALACRECARLRDQHIQALLDHVKLQHKVRKELWRKKRNALAALTVAEAGALRDREQAEAALRQHALIAHGEVETAVQLRRAG